MNPAMSRDNEPQFTGAGGQQPSGGRLLELLNRARSDYEEVPSLCLTLAQAQRLWLADEDRCAMLLDALVDIGYLRRGRNGYLRA